MTNVSLSDLGLIDAEPDAAFANLTELASCLLGAPVALVSLIDVDRDRQVFKATTGCAFSETPLSHSFCRHVVGTNEPLMIADAKEDHRVWNNPAIDLLGFRSYLGVPVVDPDGNPVLSLCVVDDRPHAWNEQDLSMLKRLARCASDTVRLKYEKRLGERLRAEQRDFAHALSHDMKAPLRTLRWVFEDIATECGERLDEDTLEMIAMAERTISRFRTMIDDVLEYSEADDARGLSSEVDLDGLLRGVEEDLGGDLERLGGRLHVDPLPVVRGDATQLSMLFRNLIDNALKFHRPGKAPRVRVYAREGRHHVEIRVVDNGVGLPAEHHEAVFRLFGRLHRRDTHEGSGIGLSLVERVARNHGGSVAVHSDGESGCTFAIRLPKAPGRDAARPVVPDEESVDWGTDDAVTIAA